MPLFRTRLLRSQPPCRAAAGGRNLRPGQALETEEQAEARQQRVNAALKEYRKSLGLDIDPATEAKAQVGRGLGWPRVAAQSAGRGVPSWLPGGLWSALL